jgi:hypothetical protein
MPDRMTGSCRALGLLLVMTGVASAQTPAPDLPRYEMQVRFDTNAKTVHLRERVTWTNRHARPTNELIFTVYPLYRMPEKDVGLLAKTVEILRQSPSVALDTGPAGRLNGVRIDGKDVAHVTRSDMMTAVIVPLPAPVGQGQSVTVELDYTLELPHKQGRWGHWDDVCYMNNWHPQLAVYDEKGWHPTPFIPWHQPFFHEAGLYTATITLPKGQMLAAPSPACKETDRGDGWRDVELAPAVLRDFALVASDKFHECTGEACGVKVRVLAKPEHAYYAGEAVRIACEAIPVYNAWFGPYPYPQLTIAEAYFPWNGNECSGMVWLDHRVFQLPHLAVPYVDHLLTHEIAHQWWYGLVGTNGYAEPFMDEAPAVYFSHRLVDRKMGRNNEFIRFPKGLGWLPNIRRENYRYSGWLSAVRRGESSPTCQPIDQYRHVIDLFGAAYDRGSRIMLMIEDRLGEAAFLDFTRMIVKKYGFRTLRVADYQRELEHYTGRSWDGFFQDWVYSGKLVDWRVDDVKVTPFAGGSVVEATLRQAREIDEPTVLGIKLAGGDGYAVRIPVVPGTGTIQLGDPPAEVEALGDHRVRVRVRLPGEPEQVSVDPDGVLPDADAGNNHWHTPVKWRFTPLYTQLDDAGPVNDYDRWTIQTGPYLYVANNREPWYTRSLLAGLRVGAVRPQHFYGGGYLAYRGDFRDVVVGADAMWEHFPWPRTEVGFNVEQRIAGPFGEPGQDSTLRAVLFGRYIFSYTSSLYLNPMHYVEVFGTYSDNQLPFADVTPPGAVRPDNHSLAGVHYSINYLTPYWDAEGGFRLDLTYAGGVADVDGNRTTQRADGQVTVVKSPPAWTGPLAQTRVAARLAGAAAWPNEGMYYSLGGSNLFRGFDLSDRQGSMFWLANLEWRIPLARHVEWDTCDHLAGIRGVYLAAFYDVGDIYAGGRSVGGVAHALGAGLRWDVAFFSFIERSIIRVDVAKTLDHPTPVQVWVGLMHAF